MMEASESKSRVYHCTIQLFEVVHKSFELRMYGAVNIRIFEGTRTSAAPTATSKIVVESSIITR